MIMKTSTKEILLSLRVYAINRNDDFLLSEIDKIIINEESETKIGKFDLFNFCSNQKEVYKIQMTGIFHEKGYKYATNGHVAIKIKSHYDDALESKIIQKNGNILPGEIFPNINALIPTSFDGCKLINLNVDDIFSFKTNAEIHKRMYKTHAKTFVKLHSNYFVEYKNLLEVCKVMKHFSAQEIYLKKGTYSNYAYITDNENVSIILSCANDIKDDENIQVLDLTIK